MNKKVNTHTHTHRPTIPEIRGVFCAVVEAHMLPLLGAVLYIPTMGAHSIEQCH